MNEYSLICKKLRYRWVSEASLSWKNGRYLLDRPRERSLGKKIVQNKVENLDL